MTAESKINAFDLAHLKTALALVGSVARQAGDLHDKIEEAEIHAEHGSEIIDVITSAIAEIAGLGNTIRRAGENLRYIDLDRLADTGPVEPITAIGVAAGDMRIED